MRRASFRQGNFRGLGDDLSDTSIVAYDPTDPANMITSDTVNLTQVTLPTLTNPDTTIPSMTLTPTPNFLTSLTSLLTGTPVPTLSTVVVPKTVAPVAASSSMNMLLIVGLLGAVAFVALGN